VALLRMQQMMHELSPAFLNEVERLAHNRRALFAPAPGDQHSFGLAMVVEFFRRAGWNVWCGPQTSSNNLGALVRRQWFAIVGFSVSCELCFEALATSIRRMSCNPAIGVMVGGPIFVQYPELVALVGADATAADGRQAALQAENLLALLPRGG
jgi:MerR family transcriptional regulator, light-induced transcriptional regulator